MKDAEISIPQRHKYHRTFSAACSTVVTGKVVAITHSILDRLASLGRVFFPGHTAGRGHAGRGHAARGHLPFAFSSSFMIRLILE